MKHCIAILVENDMGEWRAVFPDLPDCEARGFSVEDVKFAAESAVRKYVHDNRLPPSPIDMSAIERDRDWLTRNNVDLSKAVVTMIQLNG